MNKNSVILDVGCGNNSPYRTKQILPDCTYYGLDIKKYNQTKKNKADLYLECEPHDFSKYISRFENFFDVVISSHNIEHCLNRKDVLFSMINSLKKNGVIYLSTPSEMSINFPSRNGTLNYYDDKTHRAKPLNHKELINFFITNGFQLIYSNNNYQTQLLFLIGFFLEPISRLINRRLIGIWEYWGFEQIIIAKKIKV